MTAAPHVAGFLFLALLLFGGCRKATPPAEPTPPPVATPAPSPVEVAKPIEPPKPVEYVLPEPAKDPIIEEIVAFWNANQAAYENARYDELEKTATRVRASRETFGNGSWKIAEFYASFACAQDQPESTWLKFEQRLLDWMSAMPESATARIAYADFLTGYGWRARRDDPRRFEERMASAHRILEEIRDESPELDPYWWRVALEVALAQGWPRAAYDVLVEDAMSAEPKFWPCDVARAFSLLPRWHGEPGD